MEKKRKLEAMDAKTIITSLKKTPTMTEKKKRERHVAMECVKRKWARRNGGHKKESSEQKGDFKEKEG